jgi:hypothetical protein
MATETLYVNSKDETYAQWTEFGSSPFLNAIGGGYIYTGSNNKYEGYFGYGDTANTPTAVTADFYAKGTYDPDLGIYGTFRAYIYDGAAWTLIGTITMVSESYQWYSVDVWSVLGTKAKVNAAQMYVRSSTAGTSVVYVDCATLTITYTAVAGRTDRFFQMF